MPDDIDDFFDSDDLEGLDDVEDGGGLEEDEDDFLGGDLAGGLEEEDGAEEPSRQLPRKVELDIEELPDMEEDEPAPPPAKEEEEEEDEEPASPQAAPAKKKSPLKLLLVFGLPLAALLTAGALALFFFMKTPEQTAPGEQEAAQGETAAAPQPARALLVKLHPFVVSQRIGGQDMVLRVSMAINFNNLKAEEEFRLKRTMNRDLIYRFLESQDLRGLNTNESITQLQDKLKSLINSSLTKGYIDKVFFQELVML